MKTAFAVAPGRDCDRGEPGRAVLGASQGAGECPDEPEEADRGQAEEEDLERELIRLGGEEGEELLVRRRRLRRVGDEEEADDREAT